MPEGSKAPFYAGTGMVKKLRHLAAERTKLLRLCPLAKRDEYECGKETTLVTIVLKHLRGTSYHETAKGVLNQQKVLRQVRSAMPVDDGSGNLTLPDQNEEVNDNDWDFRNFSDDWLPKLATLNATLVAEYKERFSGQTNLRGMKSSRQC